MDEDIDISKISKFLIDEIYNIRDIKSKEGDDDSPDAVDYKIENQYNRLIVFHSWFLRCSLLKKIEILKGLAWQVTNLNTLLHVINTIYSARTKDSMYSYIQNLGLFKNDIKMNDDCRTVDETVLEKVINDEITWFKTLDDYLQYRVILDKIKLADSCIHRDIFTDFEQIYRSRYREIILPKIRDELDKLKLHTLSTKSSKLEKSKSKFSARKGSKSRSKLNMKSKSRHSSTSKEKKSTKKKSSREKKYNSKISFAELANIQKLKEEEAQKHRELESIRTYLNDYFVDDSKTPLAIQLNDLMQKWDTFMGTYNKKLGITVKVKKESKKAKPEKKKKEKISKDLADQVQLLPIWINKMIVANLDSKTLKACKGVNKYWSFLLSGIKQDNKCRIQLNKDCAKLQSGLRITKFNKVVSHLKLTNRFNKISITTDPKITTNYTYSFISTNTLMSDLYKSATQFNICGTRLVSFPRQYPLNFPLKYIED